MKAVTSVFTNTSLVVVNNLRDCLLLAKREREDGEADKKSKCSA